MGDNKDYDPTACADLSQLSDFLQETQPEIAQALNLDSDNNTRQRFLNRLRREVQSRGIIGILRNGIEHGQRSARLFYGTPSPGNQEAAELHAMNRFSVTRQVHYSTRRTSSAPGTARPTWPSTKTKAKFCTELASQASVFLPFDKGYDGGAGNPPNPQGLRTDYLWQETVVKMVDFSHRTSVSLL